MMTVFLLLSVVCHLASSLSTSKVGVLTDVQTEDEDAMKAAEFAVSHLNRISTSKHALILTQLKTRKHTQMASSMYNLTIKAGLSQDCLKDGRLISPDFCPDDYCRPNMTTAKYFQVQVLWQANAWYKVLGSAEFEPEEDERQFQIYILKYQKEYFNNAEEYEKRFIVFKDNLKEIERMKLLEKGTATHEVNAFADLSKEEFFSHHTMPQGWQETGIKLPLASELLVADIPPSFDWRTKGVVSEVKDQGNCGSCWAFSTTGNIEGQWAINCHKLYSLSEQELIDCDTMDQGCNGGLPSIAYQQVMKIGGLVTESQYPYTAYSGHCQLNKKEIVVNINGSLAISSDEDKMATWLYARGPISIGINAAVMQFYSSGISDPWASVCNPQHLDHGGCIYTGKQPLCIAENGQPFWTIKNSWGSNWGEKGYYRIVRGKGMCGLNRMPTSATVNCIV